MKRSVRSCTILAVALGASCSCTTAPKPDPPSGDRSATDLDAYARRDSAGAATRDNAPLHERPTYQNRCGWLDNPTPGNWWLTDKDGEWSVGMQGGYQAPGIDKIPDFGKNWQATNAGFHGYGCACMRVIVDAVEKQVLAIGKVNVLPLQRCKEDRRLSQENRAP